MQTVLLGSSNSAIVEFLIPEEGSYIMVDHHFANASQGAVGIVSTKAQVTRTEVEHHNFPASATPTDPQAVAGKVAFESKCFACHSVGAGDKMGPDLLGVTKRRTEDWLAKFLKSPEQMFKSDPVAQALLKQYKVPMPNQNLSDEEIRQYMQYFKWVDEQPPGTVKSGGGGH